jgi:hypothetical protein
MNPGAIRRVGRQGARNFGRRADCVDRAVAADHDAVALSHKGVGRIGQEWIVAARHNRAAQDRQFFARRRFHPAPTLA